MRLVVEVITIGGGLPDFLGASFSGRVLSVSVDSVSMSLVLRGAKKLLVITVLLGNSNRLVPAPLTSYLLSCSSSCCSSLSTAAADFTFLLLPYGRQ
jgi:hypothetical protein